MITPQEREEIEKEAKEVYPVLIVLNGPYMYDQNEMERIGYKLAATKYRALLSEEKAKSAEKDREIERLKLEIKILRRESREIDINYDLHEGRGENNELL